MRVPAARYAPVLAITFFIATLARMSRHEMWRDELGTWIHVTDASSFTDLMAALEYGGHPKLWPMILLVLNQLSTDPAAMQVLHALIASGSIYLLFRFAPFSSLVKLLLACSYLLAFEYAVISRQYSLIVLALFALLAYKHRYPANLVVPALLIFVMAEGSVLGMIIAIAAALALLTAQITRPVYSSKQLLLGVAIIVTGLTIATIDMMPHPDYGYARGWIWDFDEQRLLNVFAALWHAYFPIGHHHWDSNVFVPKPGYFLAILCIVVITAIVFALRRCPAALTFFLVATSGLLLFFYIKFFGFMRHHGLLFLVLVGAFWLMFDRQSHSEAGSRSKNVILYPVLLVQFYTSVIVSYTDWNGLFSGAKKVAEYIRQQELIDHPRIGHGSHEMSGISWELNEPMYLLQMEQHSRRVIWDLRFNRTLSVDRVTAKSQAYADRVQRPALLIVNNGYLHQPLTQFQFLDKIPKTTTMVFSETYYLYLVHPRKQEHGETAHD